MQVSVAHITFPALCFQVVTIEAKPFIYADPASKVGGECETAMKKILCPKHNSTDG